MRVGAEGMQGCNAWQEKGSMRAVPDQRYETLTCITARERIALRGSQSYNCNQDWVGTGCDWPWRMTAVQTRPMGAGAPAVCRECNFGLSAPRSGSSLK